MRRLFVKLKTRAAACTTISITRHGKTDAAFNLICNPLLFMCFSAKLFRIILVRFVLLAVRNDEICLKLYLFCMEEGGRGFVHYLITTYTHVVQKRQVTLGVVKETVANAGMIYVMNDGGEDGDEFVEGRHMSCKL